jgi:hypothetical protein
VLLLICDIMYGVPVYDLAINICIERAGYWILVLEHSYFYDTLLTRGAIC